MPKLLQVHNCLLDHDPDCYQSNIPPNASCWQRSCENWQHITTVSDRNPRCRDYFKSRAAIFKERRRHQSASNFGVIHPFSRLAMYREVLMFFVWSVTFIVDPFVGTFMMSDYVMARKALTHQIIDAVQCALAVIVMVDIVINFFLGYVCEQTQQVVLDGGRIAKRYAKTYFFFDLVAMINTWVPADVGTFDEHIDVLVHQLFIFRLARVSSLSNCFVFLLRLVEVPESIVQCTNIVLSTFYILNWLTCLLAWVPLMGHVFKWRDQQLSWTLQAEVSVLNDVPLPYRYMSFLLITMCHFYGASTGAYHTDNMFEYLVFSIVIMIGIGYYTYAMAVINQLFRTVNISETMYMDLVAQVNQYANNKKLKPALKSRLIQYYETKFQRKYFNDHAVMHSLSDHLRFEAILYSCRHMIETVYMFRGLSRATIGTIVSMLKQEMYLPGDVLAGTDVPNLKFHFISYGTLSLMLSPKTEQTSSAASQNVEEFEVMHLEDGDVCGNSIGMWLHNSFNYRVIVLERTEIYSLPRSSYEMCKIRFPELDTVASNLREKRQEYINKSILAKEYSKHQDILEELSHGKILLVGRKR